MRPRGRGFRGGGRGHHGGEWMGRGGGGGGGGRDYQGRGNYRGGGRGMGHRGGFRQDHYQGNKDFRNRPHPRNPKKFLSELEPEAQLALTSALINSVLRNDARDSRGNSRERNFNSRYGAPRREGRGGYFREDSRDRRHFGEDRRPHDSRPYHEGRGRHFDREKGSAGSPHYRNKRYPAMPRRRQPSPHGRSWPPHKRQRFEKMGDDGSFDRSSRHEHDYEEDDYSEEEQEKPRKRKRHSFSQDKDKDEGDESMSDGEKNHGSDDSGGMQVTIKSDGERAFNNEGRGRPRVAGRLFVELKCPHCSCQKSITFKEYKYHLGSDEHKSQLNRLARKHSVVLRKIRMQQRQEQKDIEDQWKEDQAEEFQKAVTRFCNVCKLAFKCLGGNTGSGISLHNASKLHRMQKSYLNPRCSICHVTFPSRMVYEYHVASISHLRVKTATADKMGDHHPSDESDSEDDELDLANFMTLDSVGDEDEVGSEHEEITGGLDDVEAAEKADLLKKSPGTLDRSRDTRSSKDGIPAEGEFENIPTDDEEEPADVEPLGMEYVNPIKSYFCDLCSKVIRADASVGLRALRRHCKSYDHLSLYEEAHPKRDKKYAWASGNESEEEEEVAKNVSGSEKESDAEDPEEEKIWGKIIKGSASPEAKGSPDAVLEGSVKIHSDEPQSTKTANPESEHEAAEEDEGEKISEQEKCNESDEGIFNRLPTDLLEDIEDSDEEN